MSDEPVPVVALVPGVTSVETRVAAGGAEPGAGTAGVVAVAGLVASVEPDAGGPTVAGSVDGVCASVIVAQNKIPIAKIGKNFPVRVALRASPMRAM